VSKYDALKVLKETRARTEHICSCCGGRIGGGEAYYREHIADRFLHTLHAKAFCAACFAKHGSSLPKLR
jgi:hypothetical protein